MLRLGPGLGRFSDIKGTSKADMLSREQFIRHLREVLVHLYEPRRLGENPLAALFGVANRFDTPSALQRILTEAIQSLEPDDDEPSRSPAWEVYEPLFYRYVEQLSQAEVADQMRMSVRQLRRKERDALEVLADLLWNKYDVESRLGEIPGIDPAAQAVGSGEAMSEELSWLKENSQPASADLNRTLDGVLDLARRLSAEHRVRLEIAVAHVLPRVPADPIALRQCLLSLLTVAIPRAVGGQVTVSARPLRWEVELRVRCPAYPSGPKPMLDEETASLNVAQQLARLCKGRLVLLADVKAFDAGLTLPAVEQLPVLVIDDNADTLQLLQRYTLGTRYRFIGTRDPEQAWRLTKEYSPQAIVLDVMMPRLDGWEMLGRLKQHPATSHIPVVVCTILAQKEMARLLGASAYVKKPVTRQAFLAALDEQVERVEETESR
jgi:CheY-like chemotaxis protein/transcriptional regulator with XRE-family HTH domain